MKLILLTQGKVAKVDDIDYDRLKKGRKWHARKDKSGAYYAYRNSVNNSNESMHRLVMGLVKSDKRNIDHIDHQTLNNQKSNLRICPVVDNVRFRRIGLTNKTGFKGVSKTNKKKPFAANIMVNGKQHFLGYFNTAIDAARVYDLAAKKHFGKFAYLNF